MEYLTYFNKFQGIEDYELLTENNKDLLNQVEYKTIDRFEFYYILDSKFYLINTIKGSECKIYKNIIKLSSSISSFIIENKENEEKLCQMNNLINYVLIGNSDCITLINMKKKIIKRINNKKYLLDEYAFINKINKNNRKCALSWDYKSFIRNMIINEINDYSTEIQIKAKEVVPTVNLMLPNLIIERLNHTIDSSLILLVYLDIYMCREINSKESRNYYLWKFLNEWLRKFDNDHNIKYLILGFSVNCIFKQYNDHSAFHQIYLLIKENTLIDFYPSLKEMLIKQKDIIKYLYNDQYEKNSLYLDELIKIL